MVANNTTNLEEELWISPSTSQDLSNQNPPEYNDHPQNQTIDANIMSDGITRDIPNIADRSHSTASDTIPIITNEAITGIFSFLSFSSLTQKKHILLVNKNLKISEFVVTNLFNQ